MTPDQLLRLRPWVEAETGMDFTGTRISRLSDAVDKVLSGGGEADLDRLLNSSAPRSQFLERVTAELTIGESFFFRNEYHFRALRERVIPEILRDNTAQREVRVWSAGCAGGEEPYSLAILLDQVLSDATLSPSVVSPNAWHVSILGTDLNPAFLERARTARFRPWSFRQTNIHEAAEYFKFDGEFYRLTERLRGQARFAYLNLVKDVYPSPLTGTLGLDLILFRNVAIYLKPEVTQEIVRRLFEALRPGGWLLLGETEVATITTQRFDVRRFEQATFHQKPRSDGSRWSHSEQPPLPVLAPFFAASSPSPRTGLSAFQTSPPAPAALPDWVPLPQRNRPFPRENSGASATLPSMMGSATDTSIDSLISAARLDEAERVIERIAKPSIRAETRLRLVTALLGTANVTRARILLQRSLDEEPLLIEAHLLQAALAEENGHWDDAERAYRRALYVDRQCVMAHFHLALVQQQQGQIAAADRSLKTTLKLSAQRDPHSVVEHGEGVCYGRLREMVTTIMEG